MKIGVIGLGFVGSAMRKLFGQAHEVVGYDSNPMVAGSNAKNALDGAEIAFICVPTPMAQDGKADISIVEEVVRWVKSPIIVIKSTVPPGTTDMLAEHYQKNLHFSPEYMGEGKQFVAPWKYPDPRDARSHPFVICGGDSADMVLDLYSTVMSNDAAYIATSNRAAELAKYMENSFLATKVAFCYEFAEICKTYDVDFKTVRELWLNDTRMGRSHTMVLPNQKGFNGKCLPKDISAIVEASAENGFDPTLLRSIRDINANRMKGKL
jgi:UDPglucose 6-dehydrogenase